MNLHHQGKRVFVVGGASGIGHAIAAGFAAEQADVAIADINPAVEDALASICTQHGVQGVAQVADVTDYAAMQAATANVEQALGPIDHVVYAAGIGSGKVGFPFWNLEPADWNRVLEICLVGAVNTVHAVLAPLLARRSGTITMIGSVAGQIGSQTDPPYSAAKAGLINFMQVAAKDMASYNVRVNAINPGLIDTPLVRRIHAGANLNLAQEEQLSFEEWFQEKTQRVLPLGRPQTAEDIANMALLLASDVCRNVTGQCINVDSGFVMHS